MAESSGKGYSAKNQRLRSYPIAHELFCQFIQCDVENQKNTIPFESFFSPNDDPQKQILFKNSIEKTKHILEQISEESYHYCGQFCHSLIRKGLARNVNEKYADWMSFKLVRKYLSHIQDLTARRLASAKSLANLCDHPSVRLEAGQLVGIEKNYSLEPHTESRARRLSLYTPEIAQILDCEPEKIETWSSCQP
jgi:hypothetical protein